MINKDSKYMSPMETWKEKFQVSEDCTLAEALRNQLINEIEYQKWASKYYRLPIIEDEFFTKNPSPANFIDSIKNQNIAHPSAIPCFEWNSILYIACLEPQKINTNQKTVFFITSLKSMESLWENIQSSEEKKEELSQKKQTTASISPKPPLQKQNTLNTTQKPNLTQTEDDLEFEYINWLKSTMFAVVDLVKTFIKFIAPEKNPSLSSRQKTASVKTGGSSQEDLRFHENSTAMQEAPDKTNEIKSAEREQTPINLTTEDDSSNTSSPEIVETPTETPSEIVDETNESKNTEREQTSIALATEDDSSNTSSPEIVETPSETPTKTAEEIKNTEREQTSIALATEDDSSSETSAETPSKTAEDIKNTAREQTSIALATEDDSSSETSAETPTKTAEEIKNTAREQTSIALATEDDSSSETSAETPSETAEETDKPKGAETIEKKLQHSIKNTSGSFLILDQKKATSSDHLSPLRQTLEETKHYINSYILFVFKKDAFIPYKWSPHLKAQKKVPGAIRKPSIFRIVHKSKQPYCGHLAPVLANNYFFTQWGFETLPKHVLLIPFLSADKQNILGAYLGISETRTLPTKCLHAVEQMIQPLSSYYEDGSLLKKVS